MALTNSETKEIEVLIRKEIRGFMNTNTVKQFEDKIFDEIQKELKRGKLENEVKDIVVKMMREFYQTLWSQRSFWESRIKNY
jgi:phosphoenolpyruvate carboxylase